ncbi:MAG: hypothetical protein CSB47_02955 [Proteobacteria bacterium]|nr:MAG: hypothetical protein CSB47_02955 [Pseudomonadota bacterium]
MGNLLKVFLLSFSLSGCVSNNKIKEVYFDNAIFEKELASLYSRIKNDKYKYDIYINNIGVGKYLDIAKLYNNYILSYDLFVKYVYSLSPVLSHKDYITGLQSKIDFFVKKNKRVKYAPPTVLRKVKVEELSRRSQLKRLTPEGRFFRKFYSMFKHQGDLMEYKLEFKARDPSVRNDNYERKVVVYFYKSSAGEEFVVLPDVLVSTNF